MRLSIILPTYNEAPTLAKLVARIHAAELSVESEVIIVDDRSTDATLQEAERLQNLYGGWVRVLRNRANEGKGACIRKGLKHALGDWVLIQDADLEYDPSEIPQMSQPLVRREAEVVYGSRFLGRAWPEGMAWPNYYGNRMLTGLTNFLYGTRLTDMETCYKLLPRERLQSLRLRANRFEFEPEVTARLAQCGVPICEVPIRYRGRPKAEGKKIRTKDFFIAVFTLLRCRFESPGKHG